VKWGSEVVENRSVFRDVGEKKRMGEKLFDSLRKEGRGSGLKYEDGPGDPPGKRLDTRWDRREN